MYAILIFFKKLVLVKKRQIFKKIIGGVTAAWTFRFGATNSDAIPTRVDSDSGQSIQRSEGQHSYQKTATVDDEQFLTER